MTLQNPRGRKSPGLVVNKAAEIRRTAGMLASQGVLPRPKTIREHLAREGIAVTSQHVSMALANTEFAYRRNQTPTRPRTDPRRDSVHDVLMAKEFLDKVGTMERALKALVALGQILESSPNLRKTLREQVRELAESDLTAAEIARRTGCDESSVRKMRKRTPGQKPRDGRRLPAEKATRVGEMLAAGHRQARIALETGVSKATVSRMRSRINKPPQEPRKSP